MGVIMIRIVSSGNIAFGETFAFGSEDNSQVRTTGEATTGTYAPLHLGRYLSKINISHGVLQCLQLHLTLKYSSVLQ